MQEYMNQAKKCLEPVAPPQERPSMASEVQSMATSIAHQAEGVASAVANRLDPYLPPMLNKPAPGLNPVTGDREGAPYWTTMLRTLLSIRHQLNGIEDVIQKAEL